MSRFIKVKSFAGSSVWYINVDHIAAIDVNDGTIYVNAPVGINGKFSVSCHTMDKLLETFDEGADK